MNCGVALRFSGMTFSSTICPMAYHSACVSAWIRGLDGSYLSGEGMHPHLLALVRFSIRHGAPGPRC